MKLSQKLLAIYYILCATLSFYLAHWAIIRSEDFVFMLALFAGLCMLWIAFNAEDLL
jgi:hypothetical protein